MGPGLYLSAQHGVNTLIVANLAVHLDAGKHRKVGWHGRPVPILAFQLRGPHAGPDTPSARG